MDVFEAMSRRHSYRGAFEKRRIPREHLQKIVQAGIQAPSACNAQSPSFVIVDEPEVLAQIAAVVDRPVVKDAAAIVACVMDPKPVYKDLSFGPEDCAAAVENMLLAITALGYASVWLDGVLRAEGRGEKVGQILGVPAGLQVRILLPLGVPVERCAQREKKPFAERAWFNRWGGSIER
jgi:nitroreductase